MKKVRFWMPMAFVVTHFLQSNVSNFVALSIQLVMAIHNLIVLLLMENSPFTFLTT
jgi:hypothetical protein